VGVRTVQLNYNKGVASKIMGIKGLYQILSVRQKVEARVHGMWGGGEFFFVSWLLLLDFH